MHWSTLAAWGLALTCLQAWTDASTDGRAEQRLDLHQSVSPSRLVREAGCQVNCTSVRSSPVCGTDGRTYRSKCVIKRLRQCDGRRLRMESRGRCNSRDVLRLAGPLSEGGSCQQERTQALSHSPHVTSGVYVPECRPDGTFAAVQCHAATDSCWCVTRDGRPIPGSSVWGRNINCKNTRGCNSADRSAFTSNLLRLFSEEYARIPKPTPPVYPGAPKDLPIRSESAAVLSTPERRVLEWKFTELDTVKDDLLSKTELRSLLRMLKKLVRPKACAKSFVNHCDLNRDGGIARTEWAACLAGQPNNDEPASLPSDSPARPPGGGLMIQPYDVSHLLRSSSEAEPDEPSGAVAQLLGRQSDIRRKPVRRDRDQEEPNPANREAASSPRRDCTAERRAAEATDRLEPEGRIFIPECDAEGLYRREQCHTATGYCWCVNETTGKPIPGTSTHNVLPDCSQVPVLDYKGIQRGSPPHSFPGCPYSKKKKYLVELLDQLTTEMIAHAQNASRARSVPEPDPDQSLEEQAARWKLQTLDRNNNMVLERREWKVFKQEIKAERSLRRCGRNFLKFCDSDENKKITLEEWIECMGLNEPERNLPDNPKRRGPNPFSKYLRS